METQTVGHVGALSSAVEKFNMFNFFHDVGPTTTPWPGKNQMETERRACRDCNFKSNIRQMFLSRVNVVSKYSIFIRFMYIMQN